MLIVLLMLLSVALCREATALKPGKKFTYFINIFKFLKIWKIYKFYFLKIYAFICKSVFLSALVKRY